MPRKRLKLESIWIIVKKREKEGFVFENISRFGDGFVMLTEGKATVKLEGVPKAFELKKGDIFFYRTNDSYIIASDNTCEYVTSAYTFKNDADLDDFPRVVRLDNRAFEDILTMTEIWQSRSWDSYILCEIKILGLYLSIMKKQQISADFNDPDIAAAVEFIHSNFKRNFTTEELSRYCALSPSYLRTKFIKKTGQTVTEYRDSLRISAAKEMLSSGSFTVNDIASELGYYDVSHFSKFFAKNVGLSPSQYMENVAKN